MSIFISLASYFASLFFFNQYFDMSDVDALLFVKSLFIAAICHLPVYTLKKLSRLINPPDETKLMKAVTL